MANNTKTMALGEILTDEQCRHVTEILNAGRDETETVKELKSYLRQHESHLEAKGVLPDYLAYVLLGAREQLMQQNATTN